MASVASDEMAVVKDTCDVCQVARYDLVKHFTNHRHCKKSRSNFEKWSPSDARESIVVYATGFNMLGCDCCWVPNEKESARELLRKVDGDGAGGCILEDFVVWPKNTRIGVLKFKPGQRDVFLATYDSSDVRREAPGTITLGNGRLVHWFKLEEVCETLSNHLGVPCSHLAYTAVLDEELDNSEWEWDVSSADDHSSDKDFVPDGDFIADDVEPRKKRPRRTTQERRQAKKWKKVKTAIINNKQDGLEVRETEDKGRGLFATSNFLEKDFVVEYAGNLLSRKEAKVREAEYEKDPSIGSYLYFFPWKNEKYCIDATEETDRFGRLINHSLTGNLYSKVVDVEGTPRLIFFAKRDIKKGEELLYDYGDRRKEVLKNCPWLKAKT